MVIEIVRGGVSRQYPLLMQTFYPDRLMTTPQPFTTVGEMWAAFEVLETNKVPAVNGSRFHASPPANTSRTPPRHQPQHSRSARVAPARTQKVRPLISL